MDGITHGQSGPFLELFSYYNCCQVSAKRRKESNNCARRLEAARDRLIRSQEHLRSLLKEKDDRKKVLIDTIAKQKVDISNTALID